MQSLSVDALVLRVTERGANDMLLTLLTADKGRCYAILKGGHSIHHREAAATQPYTWSNFEFYEKNHVKWVKSATALDPFSGIRYDGEKLFLAAYFCEVLYELSDEKAPAGEILPLGLNALHMLSKTKGEDSRIKAAFEMRAAAIAGFAPELSHCKGCKGAAGESPYLDVMNGALLCADCLHRRAALAPLPEIEQTGERNVLCPLTAAAAAALAYVVEADAKRVFSFRLKDDVSINLFERAAEAYLLHHLERSFEALESYKRLLAFQQQMLRSQGKRGEDKQ